MIYYNSNIINDWYFGASDVNMVYKNGIAFYRKIGNKPAIPKKFQASYSGGETYSENCDDDPVLTSATTKPSGYDYTTLETAVIGDCITSISRYTFHNCSGLTEITIPDSVTDLGQDFCYHCSSLSKINSDVDGVVNIPSGVTSIDNATFESCNSLTAIKIPNSVTSIGNNFANNCSGLTSVEIGSGVIAVGSMFLYNSDNISSITVDSNNPYYDSRNNCNALIQTVSNLLIRASNSTTVIPNTVSSIGSNAFDSLSITSINIPNSVTSISQRAFRYCRSLTSCTIGSGVISIGNDAFYYCRSLTSIVIPSSVTSIGSKAFYGCSYLQEVHFQSTTPPTISSDAFAYCSNLKHIYIPSCQYGDAYAATDGLKGDLYEYIYAEDSTHCEVTPPAHDYSEDYFTVVSESAGTSVQISGSSTAMTFQVSTNGGTSWGSATRIVAVSSLSKGAKVLIRSSKTLTPLSTAKGVGKISITGACSVEGNVLSLMYGSDFKGKTTMQGTYCFYNLFYGCMGKLLSVENLVLPATALKNYCYQQMFYGCSEIKKAPILPATALKSYCYEKMFYGCSSLSYIKAMFTTTPSTSYTGNWVNSVANSGTFVKNAAATWDVRGTYAVPNGWTVQTESS